MQDRGILGTIVVVAVVVLALYGGYVLLSQ